MELLKHYKTIFSRELKSYFYSPIAYIVISIFLVVTGWFFYSTFFLYNQAELRNFFQLLPIIFSFIIPAVTMKLFSEELNLGSYEIIATMPVTFLDIIAGKFLAAFAFTALMLAPTVFYAVFTAFMGKLDHGPVIGGYLGALLLGGSFSAIGLFASTLSRNQIIAFIIGMIICFSLTLIDKMLFFLPSVMLGFFQYLGADYHFQNISRGIIDTRDILYFCTICFISLYGCYLTMQEKKA
ncbi:MAG: ABC transporter [Spirochaetes bacterium GWF1_41_5]|nr:MAG: ABC transporter [Spirochaetes bacterium GWF1_41_5]HBE01585.1 ABC transporter [Spirochaetia bacterium]